MSVVVHWQPTGALVTNYIRRHSNRGEVANSNRPTATSKLAE